MTIEVLLPVRTNARTRRYRVIGNNTSLPLCFRRARRTSVQVEPLLPIFETNSLSHRQLTSGGPTPPDLRCLDILLCARTKDGTAAPLFVRDCGLRFQKLRSNICQQDPRLP